MRKLLELERSVLPRVKPQTLLQQSSPPVERMIPEMVLVMWADGKSRIRALKVLGGKTQLHHPQFCTAHGS